MKILKTSFALLTFLFVLSCEKEEKPTYSEIELEILELVNQHRATIDKEPLIMHQYIFEEAIGHTSAMISLSKISHDGFSERAERIKNNVGNGSVGENVAYGYPSATAVVNGWLLSDDHRQNIEGDFNLTGIAARKNKDDLYYFTQIFLNYSK